MNPPQFPRTVTGRVTVHPRGFGFLTVKTPGTDEVLSAFIIPPDLNAYLAGDTVSATVTAAPDGRLSASALALIERPREQLFGEVVTRRGTSFLRVDREVANTDWPLDTREVPVAPGDFVVARIVDRGVTLVRKVDSREARALEQVIARHGLRSEFAPEALAEAEMAAGRPHTLGGRRDLRDLPTVTVDAPSTRDIDDAICVLPAPPDGAMRLLVSIADPAEFIPEGGALDRAARERATSAYLTGRVLPMLPEQLSAAALSLVPGQDRFTLTVEMRIDPEGRVTAADVYESVIRSWARLNYTEMAAFLDHNQVSPAMEPVRESLPWFRTAAARLSVARARRGGVRFEREEGRVTLNAETGAATGFESAESNSAHALIERFMVAANEAIATWLYDRGVPALFRVHDEPDAQRLADLAWFARNFGYEPGFGPRLTPLALAAFDAQIAGAPSEPALRSVMRRALGPARYTVNPVAHFGIAAPLYLHFTSPLRRYADLLVHRTIKQYLHGRRAFDAADPALEELAHHINERARAAGRAESDRHRMLLAEWMTRDIGKTYSARITRVLPFGVLVQLDTATVEGMLPAESLPDGPYQPDARETSLVGPARSFTVGTALRVRLVATDPALGRIEFALDEPTAAHPQG